MEHKPSLIIGSLCLIFVGLIILWLATLKMPDIKSFSNRQVIQSTKIYDRTGKVLLYDVFQNTKRTVVPFEDISRFVKNGVVAIEDKDFYTHKGIKITSIIRAVLANIGAGSYSQGGSTITQQVVKNSVLTTEKSISRKLKEWIFSLKIEKVLTKDEILSMYLNESPYGGSIYGVQEASKAFFGKDAKDVTLAEAAYLSAIPKAPSYYSPYGSHKTELDARKNLVLTEMFKDGMISSEEMKQAISENVIFKKQEDTGIKAPHFVMYVKDYLEKKYGKQTVEGGGLKVITTLDYNLQEKAEKIAKEYALLNTEKFNAENVGLVAIDPKTGGIILMVGSRDYFDKEIDGNFNIATAERQPGSTFKPFAYATAFNKGYLPDTVLFDLKTEFDTECNPDGTPINPNDADKCYQPENYDGLFRGPISLRNALAQSINIPAIKTLYLAGIKDTLKTAKSMGITSLKDANQYGLTLVLGGGEVSLLEMTSAYSVFADNGWRNPYTPILKVEDKNGNILEELKVDPIQVIPEQSALYINDILSDDKARTPAYGICSTLCFAGRDVAAKTGTTNDYRDAWTIGYTPNIVLGVWAGNNDNSPMEKKVAGQIVAPLWRIVMNELLTVTSPDEFKKPSPINKYEVKPIIRGFWQGNKNYFIDTVSGKLATEYTPEETKEEKVIPQIHSILYWVNKNDPAGLQPIIPNEDPQFERWEYAVLKWKNENGLVDGNESMIPTVFDDIHRPELKPSISIQSPISNMIYNMNDKIFVSIQYIGRNNLMKADMYINGDYINSISSAPFQMSFSPSDIASIKEENEIMIVAYDSVWNRTETKTTFRVSIPIEINQ